MSKGKVVKIWLKLIVSRHSSEQVCVAPLEVIKFLEEEIVLATKKFAILFPLISIAIYRSDEEEPIFSTFGLVLASTIAVLLKLLLNLRVPSFLQEDSPGEGGRVPQNLAARHVRGENRSRRL